MAKKNNSIHPILILLGFIALIITKLVEFITENILPILTILGLGLGTFLVYNILKQRNKQKAKRQPNKESTKQANVPFAIKNANEKPKNDYSDKSAIDTKKRGIDLKVDELTSTKLEISTPIITDKKNEKFVVKEYTDNYITNESAFDEQIQAESITTKTIDEEIRKYALTKYPKDHSLQEYIYKEQVDSKAFMTKALDLESKKFAIEKYPADYSLQEYVYKEQIKSKDFISNTLDIESKKFAIEKYPNDYSLQEYIYKEQVAAKSFMDKATEREVKEYVVKKYPTDYSMQKYIYNEQIALAPHKRQTIKNQLDETIIDINSEELDLTVEQSIPNTEMTLDPPFWSHTYVYSYDEINHATPAQKKYYSFFKNKILNGEFVDIQGYTNYAFILYFDLLNEYEKHQDIKILEKQFKLLGECCPKTKSYALISLQDFLRKKGDSDSRSRLEELQDTNYQFEHGFSNYDPDAFKLGKKYKDKLDLSQQEVTWLNKFENQYNVFTSIEGCCISTIKQYLLILKEINKKLKKVPTTVAKEVDFFKQAVFEIKGISETYWGVYDQSFLKKRVESDIYNTIFRRVENSVRDEFGHKRKVGEYTYYEYNDEFEKRIGYILNELISELKDNVEKPDTFTQIELNAQNVNRWKLDYKKLTDSFLKNEMNHFIDGIINIEVTNQKNPNIENIFYESSKFIAKYDKVQALKYYAKYIYYDLKSKKFDNQQLTTTIQKSLFTTNEQLVEFQSIIGKLIQTSNIEEALDEISNIYVPKRKKIILDKTQIKEVEKKHTNTVELLNEILVNESVEFEVNPINNENKDEELEVSFGIKTKTNLFFKSEIDLNKVQEQLVQKIASNSFWIHQNEVEKFALDNGLFKNQLIDSINEICAEFLEGQALIEEEEANYIIDESYYLEIVN